MYSSDNILRMIQTYWSPELHSGSYQFHQGTLCPYQHTLSNSYSWVTLGFTFSRKRVPNMLSGESSDIIRHAMPCHGSSILFQGLAVHEHVNKSHGALGPSFSQIRGSCILDMWHMVNHVIATPPYYVIMVINSKLKKECGRMMRN